MNMKQGNSEVIESLYTLTHLLERMTESVISSNQCEDDQECRENQEQNNHLHRREAEQE